MKRIKGYNLLLGQIILLLFFSGEFYGITSGADFLRIPKSARAIGLGESSASIIGDSTALDYNPAVMNTIRKMAFSSMYQTWIDNTFGIYGNGVFRLGVFVLGASCYYFDYGGFSQYDSLGNLVNTFNPHDISLRLGLSFDGILLSDYLEGFSMGASLAGIERKMLDEMVFGLLCDIGANYSFNLASFGLPTNNYFSGIPINVGASLQNIGFQAADITPVKFTIGISAGLVTNLIFSMDLSTEYGRIFIFKMGLEYTLFNIIILRAGFNLGKDIGNYTCGAGIRIPFYFNDLRVDYAFSPLGIMGYNHNVSLYIDFPFEKKDYEKIKNKAEIYYDQGKINKAQEMLEKISEIKADDLTISNRIIEIKNKNNKNKLDLYYQRGVFYYIKGDYKKALEIWEKAYEQFPLEKMLSDKIEEVKKVIEMNRE